MVRKRRWGIKKFPSKKKHLSSLAKREERIFTQKAPHFSSLSSNFITSCHENMVMQYDGNCNILENEIVKIKSGFLAAVKDYVKACTWWHHH